MSDAPERIMVSKCHPFKEPDDLYVCHPRLQHPAAVEFVRADVVKELVEAARAMLDRHVLYCGGPGLPHAGHTDEKLFARLSAVLAKLEGGE